MSINQKSILPIDVPFEEIKEEIVNAIDVPFADGKVEIIESNHFFGVDDKHYHVDASMYL